MCGIRWRVPKPYGEDGEDSVRVPGSGPVVLNLREYVEVLGHAPMHPSTTADHACSFSCAVLSARQ